MLGLRGLRARLQAAIVLSMVPSLVCMAADEDYLREEQNGYTWCFTIDSGEATITPPQSAALRFRAIEPEPVGRLVIPSTLGGCPVRTIQGYVFASDWNGYDQLTEVVIPEGVQYVSLDQRVCANVTFVSLPSSLPEYVITDSIIHNAQNFHYFPGVTHVELFNPLPMKTSFSGAYQSIESVKFNGTTAGGCADCWSLREVKWTEKLTAIRSEAFRGCRALAEISLPPSVMSVGKNAFQDTKWWEDQPDGLIVLDGIVLGCKNSTPEKIVIPEGARGIADYAFQYCGLMEVSLPSTLKFIGASAFSNCMNLKAVDIPGSVETIESSCFSSCPALERVSVGNGCRAVSSTAFRNCYGLNSVDLPDSVVQIEDEAFANCNRLLSLRLPAALKTIGKSAFTSCTQLRSVSVPASVVSIGESAFSGCSNLASVEIASSGTSIGDSAFSECSALRTIRFEPGPWEIGSLAFDETAFMKAQPYGEVYLNGVLLVYKRRYNSKTGFLPISSEVVVSNGCLSVAAGAFSSGDGMKRLVLPETVRKIGESACRRCIDLEEVALPHIDNIPSTMFRDCTSLRNLSLPDGVKSIGTLAFYGCKALEEVVFPEGLTSVGASAYEGCTSLKTVGFPEGDVEIGVEAFMGCAGLVDVGSLSHVTSIGSRAFSGCASLTNRLDLSRIGNVNYRAFEGCAALAGVDLAENVESIGDGAFKGCARLTELRLPEGVLQIGEDAFRGIGIRELTVPASVRSMGDYAFGACHDLRVLDIRPRHIGARYGDWFKECDHVESITCCGEIEHQIRNVVPDSCKVTLTNLNIRAGTQKINGVFGGCPMLRNVTIPDGVEWIDYAAFKDDTGLGSLFIPRTAESILYSAFDGCSGLTNVHSLASIRGVDFIGCVNIRSVTAPSCEFGQVFAAASQSLTRLVILPDEERMVYDCGGLVALKEVVLPDDLKKIGDEAFKGCESLASLSIPDSVDSVGRDTMAGTAFCNSQSNDVFVLDGCLVGCRAPGETVVVPDGCRLICDGAFSRCGDVKVFELPSSVRFIGKGAFAVAESGNYQFGELYYNGVLSVYFHGDAPSCDPAAYSSTPLDTTTYVLKGSRGWDGNPDSDALPSQWMNRRILHWDGEEVRERPVVLLHENPNEARDLAKAQGKLLFVLSGADWCPFTSIVKECLTKAFAFECFDNYVVYYCNVDNDVYGMADGVPSYGVFAPEEFLLNWDDGLLAYGRGGVEEIVKGVLDDGVAIYEAMQTEVTEGELVMSLEKAGWHEVSFSVLPKGGRPADVFAAVSAKIGCVMCGSNTWNPNSGGTLSTLEIGKGYRVQTLSDKVEWKVSGECDVTVRIPLGRGWNLIGYPLTAPGEIGSVLKTAFAKGMVRYVYSGAQVYPGTLTEMKPGKGYWVYADEPCTISFDRKAEDWHE